MVYTRPHLDYRIMFKAKPGRRPLSGHRSKYETPDEYFSFVEALKLSYCVLSFCYIKLEAAFSVLLINRNKTGLTKNA